MGKRCSGEKDSRVKDRTAGYTDIAHYNDSIRLLLQDI
jgi:hypothetical protein